MAGYPTPPPTSSPKSSSNYQSFAPTASAVSYQFPPSAISPIPERPAQESYYQQPPSSTDVKLPAQETYYQQPPPSTIPNLPAQETYYQQPPPSTIPNLPAQETYYQPPPSTAPSRPAQETYFHTTSVPSSPTTKPFNNRPTSPLIPPRRRSSPWDPDSSSQKPNGYPAHPSELPPRRRSSPTSNISPNTRPFSPPLKLASPRPLYSSPLNPTPSPFNASRPQPRPGFLKRVGDIVTAWIRKFMKWSKGNPIKAGLLTFVPIVAGAGIVKMVRGVGKMVGLVEKGDGVGEKLRKKLGGKGEWGYGLDDFKGFGGSKGGPLEGALKIIHMLVNHWCKLTPSAAPRLASILMELYFLEGKK